MRPRLAVGCALVLAAAVPAFAQDAFEPNPSLAQLSADDAYARRSARSLKTAGIDAAVAIRLDDAGRVVVAGGGAPEGLLVARLDAEGRLDPTFGTAGVAEIPVWGTPRGFEIDAAGRIVVTGAFGEAGRYDFGTPEYAGRWYGAARLRPDGSLDSAFSGDGLLEDRVFLGPVHASGDGGAMLALAAEPGSTSYEPLFGLVRIAADGTIDAMYGDGGFAQIAHGPSADYVRSVIDSVSDFAVDSAGRAVVAVWERDGYDFTVRLDAAGGLDPSFWTPSYYSTSNFTPLQIALDGAGRIVGLDPGSLMRRLPDGAPDATFSGDGYASRVEAAGFPGGPRAYAEFLALTRYDPNLADYFRDEVGLLAVATRADRWVLAKSVGSGIRVQRIDPSDPGAIVWTMGRSPRGHSTSVAGLAIAPDGTAAYALGNSFVLRVDLASAKPEPLPDLRVRWIGVPRAIELGGGRYRVTADVRITNASRHDAWVYGQVGFALGSYGIPPDADGFPTQVRLRGRTSVVKRFTWEGGDATTDLAGARLTVQVSCELPDSSLADNVATSAPMTPVDGRGATGGDSVPPPGGTDAPYGVDTTFGDGGVVRVAMRTLSQPGEFPQAAGVDSQGRIVVLVGVAPVYYAEGLLLRLLPDGRLDPTFGDAGRVDLDNEGLFDHLAIDPSDRIVLVRDAGSFYRRVDICRFDAAGQADAAFGVDGLVTIPAPDRLIYWGTTPVTTDAAGNVLVAFTQFTASPARATIRVVRLTQSGQIDATFGVDGAAMLPTAYSCWPTAIAVDGVGRIVVGGGVDYFHDVPTYDLVYPRVVLGRFLEDGTPDPTFISAAVDARYGTAPGEAGQISFDPAGRIVVPTRDGLWRFGTDGGSGGPVSDDRASRAGLAVGDRGYVVWQPGAFVDIHRYGFVRSTIPAPAVVRHMLPLPGGSVVAVGASDDFGDTELLVVKLTPGGGADGPELRPSFDAPVVYRPRDRAVRGSFTVTNSGTGDAAPSTARLSLSGNPSLDGTLTRLRSVRVGRVAAGESKTVRFRARVPRGAWGVLHRYIVVQLDAKGVLREAWRLDDVAAFDFID